MPSENFEKRTVIRPNGYVYLVGAEKPCPRVKIGFSQDPDVRLAQLNPASPLSLEILAAYPSKNALQDEQEWHKKLADYRHHGEWFDLPLELWQEVFQAFMLKDIEWTVQEMDCLGFTWEQIDEWLQSLGNSIIQMGRERKMKKAAEANQPPLSCLLSTVS